MKDLYAKLAAKYQLPEYGVMDSEFEISTIDEEDFILRNTRRKIDEKIEASTKILDNLLHPESDFASYREANIFSSADRDNILDIYRRLMFFGRRSVELSFEDSDDLNAMFIRDFMVDWPSLKKSVMGFVSRMKDSWESDISKKEVVGYFG